MLCRRGVALAVAVTFVAIATTSCGHRTTRGLAVVAPRYPNVFGTAVAERPDAAGNFFAPRGHDVTLTLSDGRRLVVPSSVETPGARGLLCRTREIRRADGTYAPPCRLQAFVSRGRAVWLDVIGAARVGTAVRGSGRWLVLADGTAIPLPARPRHPLVNCPGRNGPSGIDRFTRNHQLVRVSVDEVGTLARVDCLATVVK